MTVSGGLPVLPKMFFIMQKIFLEVKKILLLTKIFFLVQKKIYILKIFFLKTFFLSVEKNVCCYLFVVTK